MTLEVFPVWMLYRDFTVPIGSVVMFAGSFSNSTTSPPEGWLVCDGRAVSRNTYNKLFKIIGTTYGAGDGSTTFNVPNFTHSTDSSGTFRPGYIKGTAPSYNSTTQRYSWSGGQFQLPNTTQPQEFNLDLVSLTVNVEATIQEYAPTVSQWQVVLGASDNNAHDHGGSSGNASATPGDYRYTYIDDADHKTATHDNDPVPGGAQLHLPGRLRRHDQSVVDLPPIRTTLNATQIWALKNDYRGTDLYFPKSGPSVSLGENTELAGFGGPNGNNDKVDGNKYISFGTYNTSSFSSERFVKFIINTEVADKVTLRLIAGTDSNGGERPNNNGTNITVGGVTRTTVDESLFLNIVLKNEGDRLTRTIELIPNSTKAGSAHDSYGSWRDYDVNLTGEERTSRTEFYLYAKSTPPIELTDSTGKKYFNEVSQDYNTKLTNFPGNFANALDNYGLGSVTYDLSAAAALGVQRPYGSYYDALGNPTYTEGEFDRFEVWNHTHRNDYTHTTSEASSGVIGGIDHPQSSVGANQSTIGSFASLNGRFFVDGSPSLPYSLGSGSAVYGEGAGPYDGGGSGEYNELRGFGVSGSEKYLSMGRYSSSKPSDGVRSFTVRLDTRYANVVEFQVIAGSDQNGAERPQALGEGLYCQINNGRVVQVIPSNQEYRFASGKSTAEYDSKYANWHTFRLPLAGVGENRQDCEFRFFSKTFSMPELASKFEKKVISAASLATNSEYAAIIGSGCAIYDFRDGPGKDLNIGNGNGNNEWGGFEHPREDGASNWVRSGDNSKNASKKYISLGSFTSPHVMNREIQFKLNTNSTESVTFTLITGNEVNGGDRPNQSDESLYLEINNPDGGSRSDILLIPSSSKYDQIAKADTTAGKNDTDANTKEWDALYGFWRDYTINLRENERGANTRFRIYAKSNTPDPWHVEYTKKTVTVSVRDLEFSAGGPLAADPKGGTYGIRTGNGVDIVPFEDGPGKNDLIAKLKWGGFAKPSGSTLNTHALFGSFLYARKDENMLVAPGGGTSREHVNTRKMSFQLDTSVSSFIEFKLIAGSNLNGGEMPDHGTDPNKEDMRLEIRDSSNNVIRSNILLIPSQNSSGLSESDYNTQYGSWKTYRITLNENERTPNTTFVLYSYSMTPTVINNKINEVQGTAFESLPGYPNNYINGVDQYGFVEVSYQVLDPKIPNVQTNYINGRDFYGLFQVSLIRNKYYPEVKLGDYLEAVDQYGLKQAETKYDTNVKWYANTKRSILPVSQETNYWVGDAYLKVEMNEGCGIYPERSSSLNPAPGKNIDNYGKGAGNNEYGGFVKPPGNAEHYISLGTFNSPFRVARRSVTFTLSTNDAYKLGFWLIAGNEYNGADVPNSSEGLKINVGGTTRTLIPGDGSPVADIAEAVLRSGGKPAMSMGSYTNGGLPTGETWSTWFGQWKEHIIPGDWYPKSNSVTFELFNELDSSHGPVDDPGDYDATQYPSSWSTSSPQIFQMHRNWTDVFAIAGINFYDRVNYYTLNSGCSIQKWRNGPGKDINVGGKGNGNNELGGFNKDTGPVKDSSITEYIMFGSYDGAYASQRKVTLNLDTRGAAMVELCVIVGTDENGGERPNETTESLYARIGGSSGRRVEVIPSQRKFVDGPVPTNSQDALWMKLYGSWHSYYIYLTESEKVSNLEIVLESNSTNTGSVEYNPTFLSAITDYPNAIDTYGLAYAAIHYSESCLWEFGEKTSLVKYESGPTSISRGNTANNNEFAGFSKQSNDTDSESYLMFGLWAPIVGTGATDGSAVGGTPVPSSAWGYRTISFKANTERIKEFNLRVRQGNDTNGAENPNPNYPSERLEMILQRGRSTTLTQTGGIKTVTAQDLYNIAGYQLQVPPGVGLFGFRTGPGKNVDLGNGKGNNEWGGFLAPTGGLLTTSPSHFLFGDFFVNNVGPTSHKPNREMRFKLNVSASAYVIFKVIAGNDVNGGERPNNADESLYLEILSGTQSLRKDIVVVPSSEASGKTAAEYDAQYGIWHLKRIDLNENERTTSTTFRLYAKSSPPVPDAEGYFGEIEKNLQKAISNYAQYTNSIDHYGLADITYDSGTPGVVISTPENANTRFDNWDNFQYGLAGDDRNEETTVFIRNYVDQDTFAGVGTNYASEIGNEGGLSPDYFAKRNFALSSDVHGIAYIEVKYDPSTNLSLPDGTGCEGNHAHSLNFQLNRGHNHVITGQTGSANVVGQDSNIEPRHLPMVYIIHTG